MSRKDEKIKRQNTTIDTLWEKTRDQEKQLAEEKRTLAKDKREFEEDKTKMEKDKATAAKRLQVHSRAVNAVALSLLASASGDKTFRLWDAARA